MLCVCACAEHVYVDESLLLCVGRVGYGDV